MINIRCSDGNAVELWNNALPGADGAQDKHIHFASGCYHFYPQGCKKKLFHVSNNDYGEKTVAFLLENCRNITISGDDAKFIFHGRITPFLLENCRDITISGISIDFDGDFVNEAELLDCDGKNSWIRLHGKYHVDNGVLHFFDDLEDNAGKLRFATYDPDSGDYLETRYSANAVNCVLKQEQDKLLIPVSFPDGAKNMHMRHQHRTNPGIIISRSSGITLQNTAIHHSGGMGVIAQNSSDLKLEAVRVIPASGRKISASDDALHFSECSGDLEISRCTLHSSLDDAINIHGLYRRLCVRGGTMFEACHFQQLGIFNDAPGDRIEFLKPETMKPYAELELKDFYVFNAQHAMAVFDSALPPEMCHHDIVRNLRSGSIRVKICNNDICNSRPRGILLSGAQEALISGNTIHTPGAGIFLSGDANFWYESGPNKLVTISGNNFVNCQYSNNTGRAPLSVMPEIPEELPDFYYHDTLNVTGNTFEMKRDMAPLFVRNQRVLNFSGNRIRSRYQPEKLCVTEHCQEFVCENNIVEQL